LDRCRKEVDVGTVVDRTFPVIALRKGKARARMEKEKASIKEKTVGRAKEKERAKMVVEKERARVSFVPIATSLDIHVRLVGSWCQCKASEFTSWGLELVRMARNHRLAMSMSPLQMRRLDLLMLLWMRRRSFWMMWKIALNKMGCMMNLRKQQLKQAFGGHMSLWRRKDGSTRLHISRTGLGADIVFVVRPKDSSILCPINVDKIRPRTQLTWIISTWAAGRKSVCLS